MRLNVAISESKVPLMTYTHGNHAYMSLFLHGITDLSEGIFCSLCDTLTGNNRVFVSPRWQPHDLLHMKHIIIVNARDIAIIKETIVTKL